MNEQSKLAQLAKIYTAKEYPSHFRIYWNNGEWMRVYKKTTSGAGLKVQFMLDALNSNAQLEIDDLRTENQLLRDGNKQRETNWNKLQFELANKVTHLENMLVETEDNYNTALTQLKWHKAMNEKLADALAKGE
jgi:hypothetical protein